MISPADSEIRSVLHSTILNAIKKQKGFNGILL